MKKLNIWFRKDDRR